MSKYNAASARSNYDYTSYGGHVNMTNPAFPVYVFVNKTDGTITRPEKYWKNFNQIDRRSLAVHSGAFIFTVPTQKQIVIEEIYSSGKYLMVSLFHPLIGYYSEKKFRFKYHYHYRGCAFCVIRLGKIIFRTRYDKH